jgi:hypothetical protein
VALGTSHFPLQEPEIFVDRLKRSWNSDCLAENEEPIARAGDFRFSGYLPYQDQDSIGPIILSVAPEMRAMGALLADPS